jgi:Holliday junction resolvase-like predicted endonuclease
MASRDGGLLQAETMLPAQYFPLLHGNASMNSGECRLVAAVLEDAIYCFQKYRSATDARQQRLFREAECWIMKEDGAALPFSFEYICGVLDIDPGYLRRGLRRQFDAESVQSATDEHVDLG